VSKLPLGTLVHILGCERDSPAERFGIHLFQVGIVVEHYGIMRCCLTPEDCSCVEVENDAGYRTRMCMQDCHLIECRRQ
jgi:hypothetical protein